MKKIYEAPGVELISLQAEDVITTSGMGDGGAGSGGTTGW